MISPASAASSSPGVGLAGALVAAGNAFGGDALPELVMSLTPTAVIAPVLVGVVVVLVAALRPVLRSSRVAPLEALRPDAAVTAGSRTGRVRIALGLVLLVLGSAALVAAALAHRADVGQGPAVGVGVLGGLVSFTGVLLAGSVIVPALTRLVGQVAARPFGATGQLAVENAVRNPARAAATASALLVGVTLVTMTAVGAATTKSAVTGYLDERYAVDVVVQGESIGASSRDALADVDGVTASAAVPGTTVKVSGGGSVESTELAALPEDTSKVLRDPSALPSVEEGTVVVSDEGAAEAGLTDGDRVTLTGPDGNAEATVAVSGDVDHGWLVTPATLDGLDSSAPDTAMYLRLADDADVDGTLDEVREVTGGIEQGQVGGGAPVREANMTALDTALAVVLALLAVSVVIALVGIANTLSLSVIERTRESALMRALGLTRGQLRGMLAIEAVLLAVVGVVLGTLLGTGYALAGVSAMLGEFMPLTPALPWAQLAAVAGVATLAGLLASVLPARRAAKVAPAAALAVE